MEKANKDELLALGTTRIINMQNTDFNLQRGNYNMNFRKEKLPVTILWDEHLQKIKRTDAMAIYVYLLKIFQHVGTTATVNMAIEIIQSRFRMDPNDIKSEIEYLFSLDIGLDDYIMK